jgi:hypothetical protein
MYRDTARATAQSPVAAEKPKPSASQEAQGFAADVVSRRLSVSWL